MSRLWALAASFLPAAVLAAGAASAIQAGSGDTCTTTGNGTEYTLHIAIPVGASQYGFAFGAPGATVTNAVIAGTDGAFSTARLAPNTSGAWIGPKALSGGLDATVTIEGSPTGRFTVVPAGASQSTYLSPVTCTAATVAASSTSFAVEPHLAYSASARAWHLVVDVPGAGAVTGIQPEPTAGTGGSATVTAKSMVQSRRVVSKGRGKVTLTLRTTPTGQAHLNTTGSIKLRFNVTFDSKDGKSAAKLISLTLRK